MVFTFGLGKILYVALLLTNAIAILSEERFLARIGWSTLSAQKIASSSNAGFGSVPSYNNSNPGVVGGLGEQGVGDIGVKGRIVNLIAAVRTLMRIPLIAANILIIAYEVVLG